VGANPVNTGLTVASVHRKQGQDYSNSVTKDWKKTPKIIV
jgi:hypothetical protein